MATQTDYPRSISVSKLTDRDVLDYDGHKIGDLDEIVLDMSSGCVDFAIVSFGGFLGIGEKHYIIPRQALHFDPEQGMFRMDVTREQVEQAPGFTRGNWPNYNDDSYMQPVFNYWGATRQQASWQRPWDPQYRKQHPEMYGQGTGMQSTQTESGQTYGEQTEGAEYVGPGENVPGAGYPASDQGYTSEGSTGPGSSSGVGYGGAYSGPERRGNE